MEVMKKLTIIILSLVFLIIGSIGSVYAIGSIRGDLMLLYTPGPIVDEIGIKAEREARNYEEALLHMRIPQYAMGDHIRDEALIRNEFFYHTEICSFPHEYIDTWGMTWRRYKFTDHALQILWVGQVVAIHGWIVVDNAWRYKLPLAEVRQLYIHYAQGHFNWTQIPIELMIGTEYGQTLEDYTNFAGDNFYWPFMNKYHYCITATFWSIMKSCYDRGNTSYKAGVESWFSNPRVVQSFDTLSADRLIGMLLEWGLIEEY